MKYLFTFISGNARGGRQRRIFQQFHWLRCGFLSSTIFSFNGPTPWFILFVLATTIVVIFGVEGIEKASRHDADSRHSGDRYRNLLADHSGCATGPEILFLPDFSQFSVSTVLGAMGQMFYSMSLAMGIMITYGSYMQKENLLEHSVTQIEIFDTLFAFVAGLMIIPAVIAFNGGDPSQVNSGPGLMFITLPMVFDSMKFGTIIGAVFFLLVLFAALTSSISLMETLVSVLMDKAHMKRKTATIAITASCLIIGMLSCLGYGPWATITIIGMQFLDFFDFISNSVLMPIVALLTCILIGHVVGTK
ncbi:MAG: sodium-dependent transporter, partial [Butyricicoccus sp.]